MTIYEALGTAYVMLMCCIGQAFIGFLVWEGIKRAAGRLAIGQETEDAAVRDFLVVKGQIQ